MPNIFSKVLIEIDSGQHVEELHMQQDIRRDAYLEKLALIILHIDNFHVLQSIDSVLEVIFEVILSF